MNLTTFIQLIKSPIKYKSVILIDIYVMYDLQLVCELTVVGPRVTIDEMSGSTTFES